MFDQFRSVLTCADINYQSRYILFSEYSFRKFLLRRFALSAQDTSSYMTLIAIESALGFSL